MKFAFKATAWEFCKGKLFLNEHFLFPMDDVLTTSSALIIQIWLHNPLESLKLLLLLVFVGFFFLNSMDFGKDQLAIRTTYVKFVESFGDLRAELCSLILDLNSDIFPFLHE